MEIVGAQIVCVWTPSRLSTKYDIRYNSNIIDVVNGEKLKIEMGL